MQKNVYLLLPLIVIVFAASCKKDSAPQPTQQSQAATLEKGLQTLNITGQLLPTEIDEGNKLVTIVMPHNISMQNLTVSFTLADQMIATAKNQSAISGRTMDFTKTVYLTVSTADKKSSETYLLNVITDLYYYGLPGRLIAENSLYRDYNFYHTQMDGAPFQLINCGPTCATMAVKWADSTFDKTVADARAMFEPDGGEWSTRNVNDYLHYYGIKDSVVHINDIDSLVKTNIDKNQGLIFCLDVYYIKSFDDVPYHHINKNYVTGQPNTGHFIFVKGYKQTDNGFYLEVDDPWSAGELYFPSVIPGELRGQDRYYRDNEVKLATDMWDNTVMIVAAKGKKVN